MAKHGQKEQKLKQKKTKRGKGKRNKHKNQNKNQPIFLTLMGSNSNGLKSKFESLKNNVSLFSTPSCITLQETKSIKQGSIHLPGYQIFQLNRTVKQGGGLLTAIDEGLDPVLVCAGDDDHEVLVVQVRVGHLDVRVFNAYGPQEDEPVASLRFWMCLEQEIIKAKQLNCCILIEMDANAKLEIAGLQKLSVNGQHLLNMVDRQQLNILNNSELCEGKITRQILKNNLIEKSAIDFILVCDTLVNYVTKILIDEKRLFTLTKFVTTRGIIRRTKSDHNILYCHFNLTYKHEINLQKRQEMFNLRNPEGQLQFKSETENTSKFTDIFKSRRPSHMKARMFQRSLHQSLRKCFKRVRIKRVQKKTELSKRLEMWSKLKIFINNSNCEKSIKQAKIKLEKLDSDIENMCAAENAKMVEDHIKNISIQGKFSQSGMWKLKKKLHP